MFFLFLLLLLEPRLETEKKKKTSSYNRFPIIYVYFYLITFRWTETMFHTRLCNGRIFRRRVRRANGEVRGIATRHKVRRALVAGRRRQVTVAAAAVGAVEVEAAARKWSTIRN